MCFERAIDLPCDPTSVPQARRFVAEGSASWGIGPSDKARSAVDNLLLVTSELISNAVKACHRQVR